MTKLIARTAAVTMIAAAAMTASLAVTTAPAEASENCKGVHITVDNPSGATIKVVDIDYWDASAGRWKSKAVKNRTLRAGQTWTWRKNLNGVAAEQTKLRVEYRVYIGKAFNKWSTTMAVVSGWDTCRRNMSWRFSI